MQGCGNQEWLPAETKLQGLAGWQSWGGPAGGSGSMGVLIAQRRRADVMSVRRCWHHSWKVSWKIEQGDVEMEKESKLREVGLAGTTQEAAFGLTCRLTVLSSSASQPFMHQLPQGGVWERRWGERREGSGQALEGTGAQTDLITVMSVLPLQNHFQIFMICQLTSVDTLLGSGINSLWLGNS